MGYVGVRWLGVGLAAVLAVVTISLAVTGRLALYINPDSTWFAVSMAIVALVGAVASFALPLGAEADHGHDHGSAPAAAHPPAHPHEVRRIARESHEEPEILRTSRDSANLARGAGQGPNPGEHEAGAHEHAEHVPHEHDRHPLGVAASVAGGVAASGVVLLTLVLPPASLSAELAMSRDVGAAPLFAGADVVTLAATGDTSSFGVGEWATVFATATDPDQFDGEPIELTGFVTPGESGDFDLTRLVITHCVIDAQPASIPVTGESAPETGQWVTVTGTVTSTTDGRLQIEAESVERIDEPEDPYEY